MPKSKVSVTLEEVRKARTELARYLPPTPLLKNAWLSEALGCELYLKLENMQPIGSFKIRGATTKILRLTSEQRSKGVIAASAGNHAQGVAWGSKKVGCEALIVMPRNAPLMKIHNTRALGAQIQLIGDTYDEAYAAAVEIAEKTQRTFVHAFEDSDVIAGQGTVALEILDSLPDVQAVVGPMGGGGLMAGVATVFKELSPKTMVVGCQATGVSSLVQSLRKGSIVPPTDGSTFADGIAVKNASEAMRQLLAPKLDQLLDADDEAIAAGVLTLMEKAKIVVEGSGALPLAVTERSKAHFAGKKTVLIITGGNIDVNLLSRIIDRGLVRAGRRIRVNVLISDRPGSLNRLTQLIAAEGANVLQVIHDRNEPSTQIDQTDVALTLETRGTEHSEQLIDALKRHALRVELTH